MKDFSVDSILHDKTVNKNCTSSTNVKSEPYNDQLDMQASSLQGERNVDSNGLLQYPFMGFAIDFGQYLLQSAQFQVSKSLLSDQLLFGNLQDFKPNSQKRKLQQTKQKTKYRTKKARGMSHLARLSELRNLRIAQFKTDIKQMSKCNLCETCSFAQSSKFLGTYMRQHLYTHAEFLLFTCKNCDFNTSSRDRATNHARKAHDNCQQVITDHRYKNDNQLTCLADQCFE